jgi:hypothetical protein
MKIGFQSIILGPRITDLPGVLDVIAELGYQGIEFAQTPNTLVGIDTNCSSC